MIVEHLPGTGRQQVSDSRRFVKLNLFSLGAPNLLKKPIEELRRVLDCLDAAELDLQFSCNFGTESAVNKKPLFFAKP
jgi:hypothetical protein